MASIVREGLKPPIVGKQLPSTIKRPLSSLITGEDTGDILDDSRIARAGMRIRRDDLVSERSESLNLTGS